MLREAIAAWQKTREPRWAAIATWAGEAAGDRPLIGAGKKQADRDAWEKLEKAGDPLDLPRLVHALLKMTAAHAAERLKVLAVRDDPRLFSELLKVLEAPPWRANVYKPFVDAVIENVGDDPRAAAAFSDLAGRYRAIIETAVGDWVGTRLARAVKTNPPVKRPPLTPAQQTQLEAAEAQFGQQLSAVKAGARDKQHHARNDDELLAAIYAAPNDDGPRLVFADALTERGDLRGELIALQVRHASGVKSVESVAREAELAADPKRRAAWALPLSKGAECTLERGFPSRMAFRATTAGKIKGEAALATITGIDSLEQLSPKMACDFLEDPALEGVREVGRLSAAVMDRLAPKPRGWRRIRISEPVPAALMPHLGAVRALKLDWSPVPISAQSLAGFHAVEDLRLHGHGFTEHHLAPFPKLKRLSATSPEVARGLSRRIPIEELEVFFPIAPSSLAGLPLRELRLVYTMGSTAELRPLVDAVPGLEHLFVGRGREPSLKPVLDALAGTALKTVEIDFAHCGWLLMGSQLTLQWFSHSATGFVDVLAPVLEAGQITSVRVGPERSYPQPTGLLPSDARLAPLDELVGRFGMKLDRDWLATRRPHWR